MPSLRIPKLKKKGFFTVSERTHIVEAIQAAEKQTSGEIRVFVESRCRFVNPLDRAAEIFKGLKMDETAQRNGVLLYFAMKDRQLAMYGDKGIHEKVGDKFWELEVSHILTHFQHESYASAIIRIVGEIGDALKTYFPYDHDTDINELPDDIVFGR